MEIRKVKDALASRNITILVHGEDGRGKTTLIKTLPYEVDEILYVAADPGQLALQPNKYNQRDMTGVDFVSLKSGKDFKELIEALKSGKLDRYKCLFIDGLDEIGKDALRLFKDLERGKRSPNMQRAYGEMADAVELWVGNILEADVSSVFITHTDYNSEADIPYTPKFPGKKFAQDLNEMFDEIFCLRQARKTLDSKPAMLLQCSPFVDGRYKVKDRSGRLDDFEEPDLGKLLDKIFS
jgi:hypothetical protein